MRRLRPGLALAAIVLLAAACHSPVNAFDNSSVRHGVASLPAGLVKILPWLEPVAS